MGFGRRLTWGAYSFSSYAQKHVMDIVAGVTLVATISLKVLQDGDTYHGLLNITHQLHGLFGITLQISFSKARFH